jgi:hypothetical protein
MPAFSKPIWKIYDFPSQKSTFSGQFQGVREDAPFDGSQGGFRCNTPMCARAHTGSCHWNRVRFLKGNAWKPVV